MKRLKIRVGQRTLSPDTLVITGATLTERGPNAVLAIEGGGGGSSDHASLTHLAWAASAHTLSTTYRLAGSAGSTAAAEIAYTAFTATLLDDVNAAAARTTLGLGNVENTALSTWAGSTSLTTLGTISTGTWQGSTLAIAYGGTGATTAGGARTALGLAIGTDVQAYDADLTALGGLGDGLPYRGGGTWGATALGDLAISGGSVQVSQARGLRESGGTTLTMGAVSAGQLLGRSGTTIAGVNASATPTASYVVVANAGGKVDSWISTASTTVAGLLKLGASGGAQAWAAILDAIAALSTTGLIARTGAGTVAARTLQQGTGVTITNGDGVSGNPTISMTGGSNTDRDATYAYTVDWYPQLSSFLADNGTLTQTGTTALIFDSNGNRVGRRTGSGAIYTTNLDTCIWGGAFTASIVVLTNTTALTGNVYKFGLTTSNTMTTALADAVQQVSVVYRQASGGNWRIITRNATTTTDTDSGVTVAVGTFYKIEIACAAGGGSVTVTIKTGDINTWTSTTSVTVTATLPVSNTYNGMYHYSGATSGTNTNYIYGAHFQQVFRTS